MAAPLTTSSTRRLRWRPSAVSFVATGCVFPKPRAVIVDAANSLLGEKIAHGIRAALGELLIEFIGAHAVRVAFDLQSEARMREQNA